MRKRIKLEVPKLPDLGDGPQVCIMMINILIHKFFGMISIDFSDDGNCHKSY